MGEADDPEHRERRHVDHAAVIRKTPLGTHRANHRGQVPVGHDGGLGFAGAPRRERDERRVLRGHRGLPRLTQPWSFQRGKCAHAGKVRTTDHDARAHRAASPPEDPPGHLSLRRAEEDLWADPLQATGNRRHAVAVRLDADHHGPDPPQRERNDHRVLTGRHHERAEGAFTHADLAQSDRDSLGAMAQLPVCGDALPWTSSQRPLHVDERDPVGFVARKLEDAVRQVHRLADTWGHDEPSRRGGLSAGRGGRSLDEFFHQCRHGFGILEHGQVTGAAEYLDSFRVHHLFEVVGTMPGEYAVLLAPYEPHRIPAGTPCRSRSP